MPKIIQDFLDGIAGIPDKNAGGCLFFCYAFFLWLKKNNLPTDKFYIVQYAYCIENIQQNLQYIYGEMPVSSSHFSWVYEEIEVDGEGFLDQLNYKHHEKERLRQIAEHGLNEAFCIDALKKARWYPEFNRKQAIKTLKHNLDLDLNHVA